MIRYKDFQPTGFDPKGLRGRGPDRGHWYVLNFIHSRDSDMIHESNWASILDTLQPDKTAGIEKHSFNHWGCGWFEIILIHPWNKKKIEAANDIEYSLENYPVLDEDDLSKREMEDQDRAWRDSIEVDFRHALNTTLNVDTDNVEESNLFFYFRDLCDKSNTYIETDYQYGSEIDLKPLMEVATLESALIALPEIQIESSEWLDLPHSVYHAIAKPEVGAKPRVIKDLEGNILEIPDFIAVQYDTRQLTIL